MTELLIEAGTLTANVDERTIGGLVLKYGETGNTNLGRVKVKPGAFKLPKDIKNFFTLDLHHDRLKQLGGALIATDTPEGLYASWRVEDTEHGNALLAQYRSSDPNAPRKLSIEVDDVVIRDGWAVAGNIHGAGVVVKGAFPSSSLMAADVGDTPEPTETTDEFTETRTDEAGNVTKWKVTRVTKTETDADGNTKTTITSTEVIEEEQADPATPEEDAVTTVPNTLDASATGDTKKHLSKANVFDILHAIHTGRADSTMLAALEAESGPAESSLFAALADVKFDGAGATGTAMNVPQWIGELWNGLAYDQQVAPLFNHGDLTSMVINGFRWLVKPAGGTWNGNKADVPSNAPTTQPYTKTAKRFAGGHDIAREHRDFNTPGFFESYYQAMTESYAQWVDETIVLTDILAGATTVKADNPAGLTIGAGLSALIDGAAEVITAKAVPSFALVSTALWKQIAKTPQSATLGYLSAALGLRDGTLDSFTIRPSSLIPAGNVLVGAREAATVYELPGVPIRVEAPDMIKGGIDTGVFGYAGTVIHKATALQLVTPYTP